MSIFRNTHEKDQSEKNQRFIERNPEGEAPRHSAQNAPTSRRFSSQAPFRANPNCDEQDEQRLMVGSAKFGSMNQNWAESVKSERNPAVAKFHSPRPPPQKPGADQRDKGRNECARQSNRLRREWPEE